MWYASVHAYPHFGQSCPWAILQPLITKAEQQVSSHQKESLHVESSFSTTMHEQHTDDEIKFIAHDANAITIEVKLFIMQMSQSKEGEKPFIASPKRGSNDYTCHAV